MRAATLEPEFVEFIPDELQAGRIYISIAYATATHLCACGCGERVVTPLTPTDWRLIFDGETVSLRPSIGNWSFSCRSHYVISANEVRWARAWTRSQVDAGREHDRRAKQEQFDERGGGDAVRQGDEPGKGERQPSRFLVGIGRLLRRG